MALHRDLGIPPAKYLLLQRQLKAASRIQRLDALHPLVFRSREGSTLTINRLQLRTGHKNRAISMLDRCLLRLQINSKSVPTAEGPGKLYYPRGKPTGKSVGCDKKMEADHAKQWIASLSEKTVCAHSDGSSCGPAISEWGYTIYRAGPMP